MEDKEMTLIERKKEALKKFPSYRGEVQSKNTIRQLPDVKVNEIFWVEMDNKPFIVAEKDDKHMTIKALDDTASISTGITIYEMNHNLVAKEPVFDWTDKENVDALDNILQKWFHEETEKNEFYLFYGRDIHYVTLVRKNKDTRGNLLSEIKEMVEEFGELISIEANDSEDKEKKLEIWVRTEVNPAELLYFFPYDEGLAVI